MEIVVDIAQTAIVGGVAAFLLLSRANEQLRTIRGWNAFIAGIVLVSLGMLIDLLDTILDIQAIAVVGEMSIMDLIEKFVCNLVGYVLIAIGIWQGIPDLTRFQKARAEELEKAAERIEALSGFLPICAQCKKIRDEQGRWNQLETYIEEHSSAEFSHGICPDCAKSLYPEDNARPEE